jgi:hypothetical protein
MESSARQSRSTGAGDRPRSPAQLFCLVIGATLVLVGVLGFFVEAKFATPPRGSRRSLSGRSTPSSP